MSKSSNYDTQLSLTLKELAHREKNTLAIVASIFRQICKHSENVEQVKDKFDKWLTSYKKTHEMLTDSGLSEGICLKDRLKVEFQPYHHEAVTITGDDVFLRKHVALTIGMCIHEFVTNSVKYGALSIEEGRIDIHLQRNDKDFTVHWVETGGPNPCKKDHKSGFGSLLLKIAFIDTLKGKYKFIYRKEGLDAFLSVPLSTLK